jgi:hypothetical protein
MGTTIFKWLLIVPALLFVDWIIMVLVGCISGLCHTDNRFFCSVYCYIGITLLSATALFLVYLIFSKKSHKKK